MKNRILPVLTAALVLMLSSCSSASVEELLSPPRLDGEQSDIYDALKTFTNGDIILKYPRSGQYRSAFVVRNLDNEPTDESIVFYEMPNVSDGSSLRLNFLDKRDGKWVSVYDLAASGSEVESVLFEDLGIGSTAMIVNYLMQSASDRYTSIMTYSDSAPQELMNIRNIYMDILDADGNEVSDIFAVTNERSSGITMASIYGERDGELARLFTAPLNSGFAGIRNVICGACDENGTRSVAVDYAFSDGSFGTDAIIYNGKYFYLAPVLNPDITIRNSNSYTPYISSKDADGDGCIEIPATVPFPDYADLPLSEQVNMTVWHSLERGGTKFTQKFRSFVGTKGDYIFLFPENWGGVTASVSISESSVVFNRYDTISNIKGEEMIRIYGAAEGNTGKYETDKYISLGKSDITGYSYYAALTNSPLSPDEETLRSLFMLQ
ncbi:MAG: hypothetical protein J6O50_14990 [Ruminiclostridium sp.]|nr:hypothetical protein [Ruminiclostridium sp.]